MSEEGSLRKKRCSGILVVDPDDQSILCYRISTDGSYAVPTKYTEEISITPGEITVTVELARVW